MGVEFVVNGDTITTVRIESVDLNDAAAMGNVGTSQITIDDAAGTLLTRGWKAVSVTEDDCASPLIVSGVVGARRIVRGTNKQAGGRHIEMELKDLNERLTRFVIRSGGNRPKEPMAARLTWLLASDYLAPLVADNGFVDYPTVVMDKNDYRTTTAQDVLDDMATMVNYNFFVYPDPTTGDPSLWFDDSNTSTNYSSTLRISDIASEIDWVTTFPAGSEAALDIDPDSVYSTIVEAYEGGRVVRSRAATASTFAPRHGVAPSSSRKKRARAIMQADKYLAIHRNEDFHIEDTVLVTSSALNLIRSGMRVQAKYEFMGPEGYDTYTWWRVLDRHVKPVISPGGIPDAPNEPLYQLGLRLSPQEVACGSIVQRSDITASPATITFDNPLTPGNIIVAVGVRSGIAAVPGIQHLGVDAGFSDLGQPVENSMDGGSEGRAWFQGKAVDGGTPAGPYEFNDGGSYLWMMLELAADLSSTTVLSLANQGISGTSFTSNLGTFTSPEGVALMVVCVGSTGVTAGIDHFINMGADWTEEYDGRRDPVDNGSRPFVGIGSATTDGSGNLAATWGWSSSGAGNMSNWSGIAIVFGC